MVNFHIKDLITVLYVSLFRLSPSCYMFISVNFEQTVKSSLSSLAQA